MKRRNQPDISRGWPPLPQPLPPHPPPPAPPSEQRQPCEVYYGHNETEHMVLLAFGSAISQLFLTPEQAEDVAKQLTYRAQAARGKKPQ